MEFPSAENSEIRHQLLEIEEIHRNLLEYKNAFKHKELELRDFNFRSEMYELMLSTQV